MTIEDDRQPHGLFQAVHWPEPLPVSIWCQVCDNRQNVVARFATVEDNVATGVHLACGHREDPPWDIRAED